MKIKYNSPVILTYALVCTIVLILSQSLGERFQQYFILYNGFSFSNPVDYFRLFSYTAGHANWTHLISNFALILVVGPMLEEKYGSKYLLFMMLITAFVSGITNLLFFTDNAHGASGIVFMLVLLSSFTSFKSGNIPLTFVLVFILYIGKEVMQSFESDNISQFGHIIGGLCGGFFGFLNSKPTQKIPLENKTTAIEEEKIDDIYN